MHKRGGVLHYMLCGVHSKNKNNFHGSVVNESVSKFRIFYDSLCILLLFSSMKTFQTNSYTWDYCANQYSNVETFVK